jgi:hypothetical protein
MNKDYSITDTVYAFANGKDKDRLNKECEQRVTDTFQTTIISTGEESLFNKCSKNTGLLTRIIEFSNVQWTTSAEQSNAIKQGIRENYGFAIGIVASILVRFRSYQLKDKFIECKQQFIDALDTTNEFTERIATKYAIILLTINVANKAFEIDNRDVAFDYDSIFNLLVDNENALRQDDDLDKSEKAYQDLLEFIQTHKDYFMTGGSQNNNYSQCYGKIDSYENTVTIPRNTFNDIMVGLKYDDVKYILKKFKEKQIMICEKGKLYNRRTLISNQGKIYCYVIKFPAPEKGSLYEKKMKYDERRRELEKEMYED